MSFQCVIVAPELQLMDETVTQVVLPAEDGLLGVLTGRAPQLARLGLGELRIDLPDGQKRLYLVEGGVAQMKDNKLTILTNAAWAPGELDAGAAKAEYDEAVNRPTTDQKAADERTRAMRRAKLKEQMAGSKT
jgi:F-type H+-transporting ATPase subunit epsilon